MKTKSFTLIELLVVIVIIGILAGVIIVSTSSSIGKANIAKVKVFENSIQNELGANMVSRWKLDEIISTTTTPDAWGNNTGTLTNGPVLKSEAECVTGKCMYFDGTDDYINFSNANPKISNNVTYSLWLKFNILPSERARLEQIVYTTSWWGPILLELSNNNTLTSRIGSDVSHKDCCSIKVFDKNWNFVLISIKNGELMKIYINGVLDNQVILTSFYSLEGFSSLKLGGSSSVYFDGYADDFRIYNSALSTSQIKQEYIAGLNSLLANNNISKEEYDQRLNSLSFK